MVCNKDKYFIFEEAVAPVSQDYAIIDCVWIKGPVTTSSWDLSDWDT